LDSFSWICLPQFGLLLCVPPLSLFLKEIPQIFHPRNKETQVTETERLWNMISSFLMVNVASAINNIFQQQWYKRLALLKHKKEAEDEKKAEEMELLPTNYNDNAV